MRARFEAEGDVIVVTGGANGIGLAAARALAAGGATVWIFDIEQEQSEKAARSVGGQSAADELG